MRPVLIIALLLLLTLTFFIAACSMLVSPPKPSSSTVRLAQIPSDHLPLKEAVEIYWNDQTVPFIVAQHDGDLAFVLGLVHAHLRLGQMELLRHASQGRLAELLGPALADIDHSIRIINPGKVSKQIIAQMPETTLVWLDRFVEGVNYYQERATPLPHEYRLFSLQKIPWQVEDLVTISRLMAIDVNWFVWSRLLALRNEPDFPRLWRRIIEHGANSRPSFSGSEGPPDLGELVNLSSKSGSNAWAISAKRSASQGALLANDPHLGFQVPNIFLLAGYKSPSYHAVGFMFPGLPFIAIGRNQQIAWGGTNMWTLSSALYDLSEVPESALKRVEQSITVRWWRDRSITLRESPFGPVVSDTPLLKNYQGPPLALSWLGHQVSDELTSFLLVNRASNWQEFREAFRGYAVSGQNMLYADSAGQIGQVIAAKFLLANSAIEQDFVRAAPLPASQSLESLSATELPAVFDPSEGFLVSANNLPTSLTPPIGRLYPSNERFERITQLLRQNQAVDQTLIKKMQADLHSQSAITIRDLLLSALADSEQIKLDQEALALITTLRKWSGSYEPDQRGPVAYVALLAEVASALYRESFSPKLADFLLGSSYLEDFFISDFSEISVEKRRDFLVAALPSATSGFNRFKNWGELHRLRLQHPLGRVPFLGTRYRYTDLPLAGSSGTLQKSAAPLRAERHNSNYGAMARFFCDMSNLDTNYFVLLGGQDGFLNSSSFLDQLPLWQEEKYLQLPLSLEGVASGFSSKMVLVPGKR